MSVVQAWVQATRIGLDAFADQETLVAWASDLTDGRPLGGVELRLQAGVGGSPTARTDASGLARLALGDSAAPLLVARRGADIAILPAQTGWWSEGAGWRKAARTETLRFLRVRRPQDVSPGRRGAREGLAAADRGRPARRRRGPPAVGDRSGVDAPRLAGERGREGRRPRGRPRRIRPRARAPRDDEPRRRDPAARGRGHRARRTPARPRLRGPGVPPARVRGEGAWRARARTSWEAPPPWRCPRPTTRGAPCRARRSIWRVTATPGHFRPPNRDDYVFGTFVPWWQPGPGEAEPERVETMSARTDGAGVHRLRIDFDRGDPPRPRVVHAEATVVDVNRQAWTAGAFLLVHPSERYVGLRAERAFVQKGEPIALDVIATDLEGRAIAGRPVRLRAERLDWEQVEGEWKEVPKDAQERTLDSGAEPVRVRFEAKEGGPWRVVARVADERGRENETELRVWVAGGRVPPRRDLEEEKVTLVPDRKEYRAGDTAKILVLAPFAPAEGVLTLRRSGLVREERFTIAGGSHTLEIPVLEGFTPNVHVQVDLVGGAPREETGAKTSSALPTRPAFASGSIDLPVPPVSRTLALAVDAAGEGARPRGRDRPRRDATRRRRPPGGERRGGGRGGGRGGPRPHRLPAPGSARRLLRAARARRLGPPPPGARPAGAAGGLRPAHAGRRRPQRGRGYGDGRGAGPGGGRPSANGAGQGDVGRGRQGGRAHPRAHRLLGARALRGERPHRRRGPGPRAGEAARQPHPLPRDGGRGRGGATLRLGRGDDRGPSAAHGPPVGAALPELRRPLRAAGGGAEPDRRRDDGGRRGAGAQRRAHRRRRPPPRRGRERPRRGALPHGRGARGLGADPGRAPPRGPPPTRPRSSCPCGRRPPPRPSPRTGRSTTGRSCSP